MKTEENNTAYAVTPAVAVDIMKKLTDSLARVEFAGDEMCQYKRSEDDTCDGLWVRYDCNWEVKLPAPIATPRGNAAFTLHVAFSMGALNVAGKYGQTRIDIHEAHIIETKQTRVRNVSTANTYLAALCASQPSIFPSAREGEPQ